jgi:hypothetical protein
MPRIRTQRSVKRHDRAQDSARPVDLYAYLRTEPWPRIGRPPKLEPETWTVTDDWPDPLPVTEAEIDLFEAWFGDFFDELFGPSK